MVSLVIGDDLCDPGALALFVNLEGVGAGECRDDLESLVPLEHGDSEGSEVLLDLVQRQGTDAVGQGDVGAGSLAEALVGHRDDCRLDD
jgi:hypothetical protein